MDSIEPLETVTMAELMQAHSETMFLSFGKKLARAKTAYNAAHRALEAVFRQLENMRIDPSEVPTDAENACNLEEAINCYLLYGKYSRGGIMREVRAAYGKERGTT